MNKRQQALYEAFKDADKNFSAKRVGSAVQPCLVRLAAHFLPDESDLQEVWDLWIEERPSTSIARFKVVTIPENYNPIETQTHRGRYAW
jgi:hypothetical protein